MITYRIYKIIMNNKKRIFLYDSAVGDGTDSTTDENITKDPNNYLAPRIDRIPIIQYLIIIALIMGIALMYMEFLKKSKNI